MEAWNGAWWTHRNVQMGIDTPHKQHNNTSSWQCKQEGTEAEGRITHKFQHLFTLRNCTRSGGKLRGGSTVLSRRKIQQNLPY